ncbi:MAG: hypothetical protein ACJAX1_001556 [Neolewinella sp.]|jgi:hypothetical protein
MASINDEGVAIWPPLRGLKLKHYAIRVFRAVKRDKESDYILL